MVSIKSLDGYDVDVTGIYLAAASNEITIESYKSQLDVITTTNKNQ